MMLAPLSAVVTAVVDRLKIRHFEDVMECVCVSLCVTEQERQREWLPIFTSQLVCL